ncbi:hypothetical protein [Virgibacillus oceani]|uniref:Uncharacterized protein n=1 Tax=Virgibacillus oceani TaxID=1479511 RepID=A0A917M6V0_9BACI|nr:hypothetical protein [Virgibacillus oceani]GGG81153.1 hypothetical protein GCM10011398_28200 [Virgibacillus oceani]
MGYTSTITVIANILAWFVIVMLVYLNYKKLQEKPKLWKVALIVFIGMIAFSYNWNFRDTVIRLPILPLGVWIVIIVFRIRGKEWQVYRRFAWLGFFSLFIFLLMTLLAIPLNKAFYPKDELSTYIANVENASIIKTHPSAKEQTLDKNHLINQIGSMKRKTIASDQWYQEITMNTADTNNIKERFPYLLADVLPKRWSGIDAIIYVEKDGKGLLITAPKGQYYFRSDDSLFREGVHD